MAALLIPIEVALNTALNQDPETKNKLSEFEDRYIAIEFTDLEHTVSAQFQQQEIRLRHDKIENADLIISAKMLTLAKLGNDPDSLFSADINIHGDVQFAKQLRDLLEKFDFDWEALLAEFTGDTLAYPISHGLRQLGGWLKKNHLALQLNLAEYFKEEVRLLPNKSQITPFLNEIDILRADFDRLEARIRRLEKG